MTDSTWAVGTPPQFGGLTYGYYFDPNSWVPAIIPDGTASFVGGFRTNVLINGDLTVGGFNILASHYFVSSHNLFFTGAGVTGGAGAAYANTGWLKFMNSSSAGAMTYAASGYVQFTDHSTAANSTMTVTGYTRFEKNATAADATFTVAPGGVLEFAGQANGGNAKVTLNEVNGGQGHLKLSGSGPGGHHKVTLGSLTGGGTVELFDNQLSVGDETTMIISGVISGSRHARLVKVGTGTMILEANNTYGGGTTVFGGELIVTGKIGNVTLGNLSVAKPLFGWLDGNGSVGKVDGKAGLLSAGPGMNAPGILHTKSLDLANRLAVVVDLAGAAGPGPSGYDKILVKGTVHLSGTELRIGNDLSSYDPNRHTLKIIDNDGKDKVAGMFRDYGDGVLKEGETIAGSKQVYSISYKGGNGNDIVLRSEGPVSFGTAGNDTINLKTAPEHTATNRADQLGGGEGDDTIFAGGGNDTLYGDYGKDKLDGGRGTDYAMLGLAESGGIQVTLKGSKYATVKLDGQAWDKIRNIENIGGGRDNDKLTGDSKSNLIDGANGNDTIKGGKSNDTLSGSFDKDKLEGGDGRDWFVFREDPGAFNADKITDYSRGQDKIVLDSRVFEAIGTKLTASELYATLGAREAHDSNDHIIYDNRTGKLYYDPDGLGGQHSQLFATLTNHVGLTASDFIVIA